MERQMRHLLHDLRVCLLLPFAFQALFWGASALDQPAPDTRPTVSVTADQPGLRHR